MTLRSMMMASAALSSLAMRAPDDGAGNAGALPSAAGDSAGNGTTARSTTTGGPTAGDSVAGASGNDSVGGSRHDSVGGAAGTGTTRPRSFDDMADRLGALEGDVLELQTRPATGPGKAFDDTPLVGDIDDLKRRVKRLEDVLTPIFGREFAEYDARNASA